MPTLLYNWDTLITTSLNPTNDGVLSLNDELMQRFIYQSEAEREKVQNALVEGVIDRPKIRDKQQYIQVNQAMLIRLLDKLYVYKQAVGLDVRVISLYNSISLHLESTLNFIEDLFDNYFDRNEKVPSGYLQISINEVCRLLELLKAKLSSNEAIDHELKNIVLNYFNKFCVDKKVSVTYNELVYQKNLMNELLTDDTVASESSIREILFYFNFNDDDYVTFLCGRLGALTESLETKKEKVAALRFEQKSFNQLRTRLNCYLSGNVLPLKEQLNHWIEEEIKFLESASTAEPLLKAGSNSDGKINTSLSVAKLALLLKIMITDKIIVNRVVADVLRIAARTISTLQKDNVAFGSLETKYHNPDRGTISAVKDILFRWINILNKL